MQGSDKRGFRPTPDQLRRFLASVKRTLEILDAPSTAQAERRRLLHTLEGEAGTFELKALVSGARRLQNILDPVPGSFTVSSLAMETFREGLAHLSTELRNLVRQHGESSAADSASTETPVAEWMASYEYLASSLGERAGKRLRYLQEVQPFSLPSKVFRFLFATLVHVIRNAIDHGLETPQERSAAGKFPAGVLRVKVAHENGNVEIEISDDGRGADIEGLRSKLIEKFPGEGYELADRSKILEGAFLPGVSSRVSSLSGRGVGLDALKTEVTRLGGTVRIESRFGQGTVVRIRVSADPGGASNWRAA